MELAIRFRPLSNPWSNAYHRDWGVTKGPFCHRAQQKFRKADSSVRPQDD